MTKPMPASVNKKVLASNFTSLRFSLGGRQIISFPIAGDIVGLRRVLLRTADHSFSALTKAVVHAVEGAHIVKCMTEFPRLGAALLWSASRDEAMVVEHLVNVGRRSALERTALMMGSQVWESRPWQQSSQLRYVGCH
jgi:CRP-like cAMP-binding protein